MEPIRISATTLGSLNLRGFCSGCFWITSNYQGRFPFNMPLPGIFSTIDGYSKRLIHSVLDQRSGLPEWLSDVGMVQGYVQKLHHSWFACEDSNLEITLTGTPDDVFILGDGSYHIVDYKTSRITGNEDRLFPMYEVQLNAYAYIAERLTKRDALSPVSVLSLIYLEPQTEIDTSDLEFLAAGKSLPLPFKPTLRPVDLHPNELIPPLLSMTRNILDKKLPPDHRAGCNTLEQIHQLMALVQE